jgi:D-aminoacyl-tRNA deacylase
MWIKIEGIQAMKALLQRVTQASVAVSGEIIGSIGPGLVVLVGVAAGDTYQDARFLAQKTAGLRIFADSEGKFNLSALDIKGEVLIISQFTLLADTRKGRRPSFTDAAPPHQAEDLFARFVDEVRTSGLKVQTGRFQAHMMVEIHNDGPVTIMLDSREKSARPE